MKVAAIYSNKAKRRISSSSLLAWILALALLSSIMTAFAEESGTSTEQWTIKNGPKDTYIVEPFVAPSKSKLPKPSQKSLDVVLSKLKRVRVIDCGMDLQGKPFSGGFNIALGEPYSGRIVFDSTDQKILKELTALLCIREDSFTRVMGPSAPTIELTLSDGKVLNLGLAGWDTIRWNEWQYDAFLARSKDFNDWLTDHGITGPVREMRALQDNEKRQDERISACLKEFVRTMPTSLLTFFGPMKGSSGCLEDLSENYAKIPEEQRLNKAKCALKRQFPDDHKQIGTLLEWEGNLSDYWIHYQSFPIELLLEYDPAKVLSTVKKSAMTPAQWIGASRFYSDLNFRRKFPSGYKQLDKALRARIIKQLKATGKNQTDIDDFENAVRNWCP